MNRSQRQSGSALLIILLGIAFFSALSYAVFRGGSGSTGMMTQEQARMAAQEIIAYGDTMAKTVQTLKLRGCADTQLDFANTLWINDNNTAVHVPGHNPSALAGCGVFKTGEGNMPALLFPLNYFDTTAIGTTNPGSSRIRAVRMAGIGGTTDADLYLMVPKLKKEICLAINSIAGIDSVSGNPPDVTEGPGVDYAGSFSTTNANTDIDGKVTGKSAYCSGGSSNYKYNRVLIAR